MKKRAYLAEEVGVQPRAPTRRLGYPRQYLGKRLTLLQNSVGSYQVFNLTLLGHEFGKHLDVAASVFNVLDKKYFDPGRPEDPEDAIQQDGRSFRIKVTARF